MYLSTPKKDFIFQCSTVFKRCCCSRLFFLILLLTAIILHRPFPQLLLNAVEIQFSNLRPVPSQKGFGCLVCTHTCQSHIGICRTGFLLPIHLVPHWSLQSAQKEWVVLQLALGTVKSQYSSSHPKKKGKIHYLLLRLFTSVFFFFVGICWPKGENKHDFYPVFRKLAQYIGGLCCSFLFPWIINTK